MLQANYKILLDIYIFMYERERERERKMWGME